MSIYPTPTTLYPISGFNNFCLLKNIIQSENIEVGDYTYYFDSEDVYNFEKNVLYHYPVLGDKLKIGKFCQIGHGVTFLMNGGNHRYDGITSFPFHAFQGTDWEKAPSMGTIKKDTIIGHDVWIGYNVTILPGVEIGSGAIIGACSVVTKDVPPYTIVAGNPAKPIRKRFDDDKIKFILNLAWWDWPIEKITENINALVCGDFDALNQDA